MFLELHISLSQKDDGLCRASFVVPSLFRGGSVPDDALVPNWCQSFHGYVRKGYPCLRCRCLCDKGYSSQRDIREKRPPILPTSTWGFVKVMVPSGVPIIIRHLIFRVPKRDHNSDNYSHGSLDAWHTETSLGESEDFSNYPKSPRTQIIGSL